jgi:hypothetical protein
MKNNEVEKKGQLVYMHRVKAEPVSWLWQDRFPAGKLSILMGDPGLGKSTITIDIASRISTGAAWPDGGKAPQGTVLILTAEDGLADTVRPRIDRQGGNPKCIAVLTSVKVGNDEREFSLATDVDMLEQSIKHIRPQIVIIDPLTAYLGGKDENKNAEIRGLLLPLTTLAEKYNVALLCVLHMNKSQGKAIYRASGSIAFGAAPRAVFCVAKDPDNDERRLFFPVKTNLARPPKGLAYSFDQAGKLIWESQPLDVDPEDVLGDSASATDREERIDAEEFLNEVLKPGETMSAVDLFRDARQNQLSERQVKYACRRLGIRSHQVNRQWFRTRPKGDSGDKSGDTNPFLSPEPKSNGKYNIEHEFTSGDKIPFVSPDVSPEPPIRQKAIKKMEAALKASGHDERLKKWLSDNSDAAFASRDSGVLLESVPATPLDPDTKNKVRLVIDKKGKKK